MKWCVVCFMGVSLFLAACGENRGTPTPTSDNTPPNGDAIEHKPGEAMQLADSSLWRADIQWSKAPEYGEDDIVISGKIFIRNRDGAVPKTVSDVRLIADMPEMGHGTGRNQPVVSPSGDGVGDYNFDKLIFTMEHEWRIRVIATVDGQADVWTTKVDVK